jgi:hypothetical protein
MTTDLHASQREPLRVVYIAGMGHSGSTLLDLLLSGHSRIASVGEAKMLAREGLSCTCRRRLEECPFWSAVSRRVEALARRPLRELAMQGPEPDFGRDNVAFFRAVSEAAGTSWIVDSSKSSRRLQGLLRTPGLEILILHLVRDPRGVVFSNLRKGRDLKRSCLRYASNFRRARDLVLGKPHVEPHVVVSYEWLAARPREAMLEIQTWLGVPFEEGQLDWAGQVRHNLGGNRMRFSSGAEIRPDVEWQTALDSAQQSTILELTRDNWDPAAGSAGLRRHRQSAAVAPAGKA